MVGASYWVIQIFLRSFSGYSANAPHVMQTGSYPGFVINIRM
jgi:hypothetical protein